MSRKIKNTLLQAAKIGIGCSAAIWIAELMNLEFASAAGTIALLTLVSTKWETVKLSFARIGTFFISVGLSWILMRCVPVEYELAAFGLFIFIIVVLCNCCSARSTISVNVMIGIHFLTNKDFTLQAVINEFLLVLIGVLIAIFLNLFYAYRTMEQEIIRDMRYTESQMQLVLKELANYLEGNDLKQDVWANIQHLESKIQEFIEAACDYQNNTFHSHPGYYISYFEMRLKQTSVLGTLHYEMMKVRTIPEQAKFIAKYILDMKEHVVETNIPTEQIENLQSIIAILEQAKIPENHEELKGWGMLYHIVRDLEDFLEFKKQFILNLNTIQYEKYWKKEGKSAK